MLDVRSGGGSLGNVRLDSCKISSKSLYHVKSSKKLCPSSNAFMESICDDPSAQKFLAKECPDEEQYINVTNVFSATLAESTQAIIFLLMKVNML